MTIFNNNTKNSRDITADNIYLNGGYKGQVLQAGENGQLTWSTQQNISTLPFLSGVTIEDVEKGHSWLLSNMKDESQKLQDLIDNKNGDLTDIGLKTDALRTFTIESPTGFIFLDDFLTIPSNTSIDFRCYTVAGRNFRLQCSGTYDEQPTNLSNAPIVAESVPKGSTSILVNTNGYSAMSSWAVNDYIALRSSSLNKREDHEIAGLSNVGSNLFRIYLKNETEDFSISSNDGTVRRYVYFGLNSNVSRGNCRAFLSGSYSNLGQGDFVAFIDKRMAGDVIGSASNITHFETNKRLWFSNNRFSHNIRQVLEVNSNNGFIQLDSPISTNFDTANSYMLVLKPKENISITGMKLLYIEEPQYPRPNNHAILLDTCVNCKVKDFTFSDSFTEFSSNVKQYGNMDNLIRIRESYNCHVNDVSLLRTDNKYTDSGSAYGVTQYFSSFCTFTNIRANGFRHNFLIQGGDHTFIRDSEFRNVIISGVDSHGLGSTDTIVDNVYIDFSDGIGALASNNINTANTTVAGIRIGNSTHPIGDSYNTYQNITIQGGQPTSNITAYYGVEVVAGFNAGYNNFNNIQFMNTDRAFAMYDHPRGRLNSNMVHYSNEVSKCSFINCRTLCDIDGEFNTSNSSCYLSTTCSNVNSNNLVLTSTSSITNFNNAFNGWVLIHNTSNYTVSNYSASNKRITLTTNFSPVPTTGDTIILKDSLTPSVYPSKDLLFANNIVDSNLIQFKVNYADNPRLIQNYISKSGDTTSRYVCDMKNTRSGSLIGNTCHNTRRFIQMSNCSNIIVADNALINQQEQNVLSDLGSNQSIQWKHNAITGFIPSYTTSASSTYNNTDNLHFGYRSTPTNHLLTLQNSNGFIGVNNSNPNTDFHLLSSRTISMQIESTSASQCAISLKDINTTGSNICLLKSSNNLLVLRGGNSDSVFIGGGRTGFGKERTNGRIHLFENSATSAFINLDNSNQINNDSNNINTNNHGSYYGRFQVNVEGVGRKWVALYD